jgi:tetratricopeptide (TPR) repeat protein
VSLALVKLHYDWDWDAAEDVERALALSPGSARAHLARAAYLSARGEAEAAVDAARRAAALDPLCPTVRGDLGWYCYAARRYEEAAEHWRQSLAVQGDGGPRDRVVDALRQMGRGEDAWREAVATMRHAGVPAADIEALSRQGLEARLRGFLSGSARFLSGRGVLPVRLAELHAAAREDERALDILERAARERSWGLLGALAADPDLARLEGHPRYDRLLRETGLRPPMMALLRAPDTAN